MEETRNHYIQNMLRRASTNIIVNLASETRVQPEDLPLDLQNVNTSFRKASVTFISIAHEILGMRKYDHNTEESNKKYVMKELLIKLGSEHCKKT